MNKRSAVREDRQPLLDRAIKLPRARSIIAGQARVQFDEETVAELQAGFDRARFARAADEQKRRREQRE